MIGGIGAVTLYTLRELARRKLLYVLVALGAALTLAIGVIFAVLRSSTTAGLVPQQDPSGFILLQSSGIVSLFAWIAAVAISITLISYDLDSGSAVSIFSKPVTRLAYAVGKLLAAAAALLLIVLVLGVGTQLIVLFNGGGHEVPLLKSFILIAANGLTQMLVIMVLSVVTNNIVAAAVGIILIQVGKLVDGFHFYLDVFTGGAHGTGGLEAASAVANVLYWIFPRYLDSDLAAEILRDAGTVGPSTVSLVHSSDLVDVAVWTVYVVLLFGLLYWLLRRKEV